MSAELPEVVEIQRITYNPDDVIVVTYKGKDPMPFLETIEGPLRAAFPVQAVLVVDQDDMEIKVFTPAASEVSE